MQHTYRKCSFNSKTLQPSDKSNAVLDLSSEMLGSCGTGEVVHYLVKLG